MTRITDEAVETGAKGLHAYTVRDDPSGFWSWDEMSEEDRSDLRGAVRAALEAALPHLEGATPVASRERLAEVIDPAAFDQTKKRSKQPAAVIQWAARQHMAFVSADRLLAAGVFREGATPAIDREALVRLLENCGVGHDALIPGLYRSELADKVLALIGGAS